MSRSAIALALAGSALIFEAGALAQPISIRDSFRIGTGGTVLCSAQSVAATPMITDMFDRGYLIACRDASVPIGELYVLRDRGSDPSARLAAKRKEKARCAAAAPGQITGVGAVEVIECTLNEADVRYRAYLLRKGGFVYAAEGFAGYDSALRLGLHTLVADKPVAGELAVATTGAGDSATFARVLAGILNPSLALAEAYRRNNAGSYAESAEFFAMVSSEDTASEKVEGLANEALQKSNLGRYAEADALFARAESQLVNDPIVARQLRNYRATHLLNQGRPKEALAQLDKALPEAARLAAPALRELVIDTETAKRLNSESALLRRFAMASASLTSDERVRILDGQALQLRGTALRLTGDMEQATKALSDADAQLTSIRGGRVSSIVWMRAQILGELAAVAEASGNTTEAERLYRESVALLERDYPGTTVLLSTRGRLAGFLAASGQTGAAIELYREIVRVQAEGGTSTPGLARVLSPYIDVLIEQGDGRSIADLFQATQVLVRPGVAQTQAMLARELSAGSDEAARLFRQSVSLSRQIERSRIDLARLQALAQPSAIDSARIDRLRTLLDQRQADQVATLAKLSDFPRFRAVSSATISLEELQRQLRPGEAYYKMAQIDDQLLAIFITPSSATAFKIEVTPEELDAQVTSLRETISTLEQGQHITYAFDVGLARHLYDLLFAPVHSQVAGVRHLIFEPDGAMLRLPPNLLIMDSTGIEAYRQRAAADADAEFDFTGLRWLGRDRDISTSVSARAFSDVRAARQSEASREYLGFGQNAVPSGMVATASGTRGIDAECMLSLTAWNRPISPEELRIAQSILAGGDPARAEVLTQEAFTDTAVKDREDLSDYRIIHFATHGIVTSPRPRCPAQPALMTSFGGEGSDGLLTFREIFDLRLDADLVILSACDTAGTASAAATREAGLAGGGEVALDGLVRAFVGAGGRLVIASHWPAPDDFNATQRLISGLFEAPPGTPTAAALRQAQIALMDDPETSHPFYWSGFATIGDGSTPVRKAPALASR